MADCRGYYYSMNLKILSFLPSLPFIPSTQVSSSTSVALLTETSLSWKHLTDTSVAYRNTRHNSLAREPNTNSYHTQTQTHYNAVLSKPLQCFYVKFTEIW